MPYKIVPVRTPAQKQQLVDLDRIIFPTDKPVDMKKALSWLVLSNGEPVGFGVLALTRKYGYFRRAGVRKAHWKKGLHRRLVRVRLNYLKDIGYRKAIAFCTYTNVTSANNLVREGFFLYIPRYRYAEDDSLYLMWELKS